MEKKWIKDLGSNECIHAPTQDIAYVLCVKFNELGLKWRSGISYLDNTQYNVYEENTHYYPYDGSYSDKDYATDCSSTVYTINDLLDFEGENTTVSDEGYTKEEIDLLDRFAGLAMNGILSSETEMRANGGMYGEQTHSARQLSDECYCIAKSMLIARKEFLKNG